MPVPNARSMLLVTGAVTAMATLLGACQGLVLLHRGARANGDPCNLDSECATGLCRAGRCSEPVPEPLADGEPCSADADCRSGVCDGAVCLGQRVADGDACERHEQCASGFCLDGSCVAAGTLRQLGAPCAEDAQCLSGLCEAIGASSLCTEACATTCSVGGFACFAGLCTPIDYCDPVANSGPGCAGAPCAECDPNATCVAVAASFRCMCNDGNNMAAQSGETYCCEG